MTCQETDCQQPAVVGVGYKVKWVCQRHYEDYLTLVRRIVREHTEESQ